MSLSRDVHLLRKRSETAVPCRPSPGATIGKCRQLRTNHAYLPLRRSDAQAAGARRGVLHVTRIAGRKTRRSKCRCRCATSALHVDETTILQIARLRGALVSTRSGHPPVFDDKHSFIVRIDSAEIALTMDSLTRLLNTHVFRYEGSPLKKLTVTADGQRLKLKGTVHKGVDLPFTIIADPSVDADGALRLRAHSIKTLGIPAKGLLTFFGVELENLVNLHGRAGMRVVEDTVVIAPSALVPPPRIDGRLQADPR